MSHAKRVQGDATHASSLTEAFAEFVIDYRRHRLSLWNQTVRGTGSETRKFFMPFREWDASHVISTDIEKLKQAMHSLDERLEMHGKIAPAPLALIALAAKNRAELMSAKSDFYPVFAALIALSLAVAAVALGDTFAWTKPVAGMGALFFACVGAYIRMATREQVAYLKEIANIVEHRIRHPEWAE